MRIPLVAATLTAAFFGLAGIANADAVLLSLSKQDNKLHVIDAASGKPLAIHDVGVGPHEVVTDAAGRFAYVSNYGNQQPGNSISVIDLQEGKAVTTIDLGDLRRPHGLWHHDGKIYFTSEVAQKVGRIDVATNKVEWTASTGRQGTHMVVVSPKTGEVISADIGGPTVTIIDPKAEEGSEPAHIEVPGQPEGIGISPDSSLIAVGDNQGGTITLIDAKSREIVGTMEGGGMPIRVGFTPDGKRILSTDPRGSKLNVFDVEKREKVGEVPIDRAPIGFVINPDTDEVFISASATSQVAVVDLQKFEVVRTIETGAVPDGIGLAFPKGGVAEAEPAAQAAPAAEAAATPQAPAAQKPRLGVAVQSAGAGGGVEISEVVPGSLAEKTGLKVGDIVTQLNGEAMDDPQAFADAIYAAERGKPLKLVVKRGEEELEFEVKLD